METLADLKAAVASALARTDVPLYVYTLAQQEIATRLRVREMEVTTATPVQAGVLYTTLPSGFKLMRFAYIGGDGATGLEGSFSEGFSEGFETVVVAGVSVFTRLEQTSGFVQTASFNDSGAPTTFAVQGTKLRWNPVPDADYTAVIHYVGKASTLTQDDDTNALIVEFPSIYLYRALTHAAVWAQDVELASSYSAMYEGEIARIVKADRVSRYAGPLVSRRG